MPTRADIGNIELALTTAIGGAAVLAGVALFTTVSLLRSMPGAAAVTYYTPVSLIDRAAAGSTAQAVQAAPSAAIVPPPPPARSDSLPRTAALEPVAIPATNPDLAAAPKDIPPPKDAARAKPAHLRESAKTVPPSGRDRPQEAASKPPAGQNQTKVATRGPDAPAARELQPTAEHWRVIRAATANAFNLGGHIDKSGIVDTVASGHLRDAFKSLSGFRKLPQHVRTLIEAENINLAKIAPYRSLLGIDDKKLEEEQGVRFERVGGRR